MYAITPEAATSTPSPSARPADVPPDVKDLDFIVEFLRDSAHPISRITAWRWVKQDGLRNWGTGREIRVSLSDFLDAHARRHPM